MKDTNLIPEEKVANSILFIRGHRVMLDMDLAALYGVKTYRLNEAVKRNGKRFPQDFMFQFTANEKAEVIAKCDHLKSVKYSAQLPYAFTEQGVAMLSGVLKSQRAIEVNIAIMRAFVSLRQMLSANKEFSLKVEELERKI